MRRSKKISKLRVTCLGERNSPVTGEFPTQMASNAEIFSIWWRHHEHVHAANEELIVVSSAAAAAAKLIEGCIGTGTVKPI